MKGNFYNFFDNNNHRIKKTILFFSFVKVRALQNN